MSKQLRSQNRDPLLKEARRLGFQITAGSKHWKLRYPNGGTTVVSYNGGQTRSAHNERNLQADLYRIVREAQQSTVRA